MSNNIISPPISPIPFEAFLPFAWVALFLLIGVLLRAYFPPFRRYMIPTCIIGGGIGFICQNSGLIDMTGLVLNKTILQHIIFHLFNLTWVFIGLRKSTPNTSNKQSSSTTKTVFAYFSMSNSVLFLAYALAMAATTMLATIGLNSGPSTLGSLVPYAFSAGAGQALTIANLWTASTSYLGLTDYALASSAGGYLIAIVLGICLINLIAKKRTNDTTSALKKDEEYGFYSREEDMPNAGKQTTTASSIDVLAWHIALGIGIYFLAYVLAIVIYILLPGPAKVFIWSLFFLFVSVISISIRKLFEKFNKAHLLCNDINNRISNTLVDFLVCATFMSIQIGTIAKYIWVYFTAILVTTTTTTLGLWLYCRKLKEEGFEFFIFIWGALIGTISSAFVLLRLIDPQGKSLVPVRVALASALSIPVNLILPLLIHLDPLYNANPWYAVAGMLAVSFCLFIIAKIFKLPQSQKSWENV